MCMGHIEGWDECNCHCDSCGYEMVRTYTRYLNNDVECKKFHFSRVTTAEQTGVAQDDALEGQLYVREEWWDPGRLTGPLVSARAELMWRFSYPKTDTATGASAEKRIVHLPVHYRDVVASGGNLPP